MTASRTATPTLFVALDIGKNVHWLGCYDDQLTALVEPHKVRSTMPGFAHFQRTVDPLLHDEHFARVVIGNEYTGIYHEPWAWQIRQHYLAAPTPCPVTYHWLNPILSKRRQQQRSIRQHSTDARAVAAIAACLRDGLGYPAHFPSAIEAQLREAVRARAQLRRQRRHLGRRLHSQIDRLWPGALVKVKRFQHAHPELEPPQPIVKSKPLDRQCIAALFLHCPNPYDALALDVSGLIALLRQHVGRGGPKTAQKILDVLRDAPLPPPAIASCYASRLQDDFRAYTDLQERFAALDRQLKRWVPQTDARFLASVPGISPVLAARYFAPIRTIDRFSSAAQIWAYAGLDPVSAASGDTKHVGHMSKRGPSTLRDTLFQIGQHTSTYCTPIGEAFLRARRRGLSTIQATLHAAHKANRLCFALLRDRHSYRPVAPARQSRFRQAYQAYQTARRARARPRIAA